MNAVTVSVDYADLLATTLPYNRANFDRVLVVTTHNDTESQEIAVANDAELHVTDAFTRGGAVLNKWAALEEALDAKSYRNGWLCLMDADVLWPKGIEWLEDGWLLGWERSGTHELMHCGTLMSPLRRMAPWPTPLPPESAWSQYSIHRNVNEWAGYSQLFHCSDPVLGAPPWHEIDWKHAGGADSLFQRKWTSKIRPSWECLHLGEPGKNWLGRATPRADGAVPNGAETKLASIAELWRTRRTLRANGSTEAESFAPEKLGAETRRPG